MTPHYLIVGSGRAASHFSNYFTQLGVSFETWSRKDSGADEQLKKLSQSATHILLLIPDAAIEPFIQKNENIFNGKRLIHCSGALTIDGAVAVHPLMTFTEEKYDLETYKGIPFVIEKGVFWQALFPQLPNAHYEISPEQKALYHALCVVSGNFTTILWSEVMSRFQSELKLPKEILLPYMSRVFLNLIDNPTKALTGPIQRKEMKTIEKNLKALDEDKLKDLYQAFVRFAGLQVPAQKGHHDDIGI